MQVRPSAKFTLDYMDEVAALMIKDTTMLDAGVYRCEAANKLGRVETECRMVVQSEYLHCPSSENRSVGG